MCGAKIIAAMAVNGMMLYVNNSDHMVGKRKWSRR
jgi:hypothetical protein